MKAPRALIRVEMARFVAGVEVEDGRVVRAAPILRWAVGKPAGMLTRWVVAQGGKVRA